ncbi:WD40/YVTN repeat-like-containing domain protein [Ophiocordyceps sinensis CO18]|uniref:WD40/YVTN repeat-like-containing domain protein n=1 Tax=Ophiocordyceps sinensis (strain Co18 / CGMCC 3.14243) TaxID=911162 RepID=T5AKE5_OPHSC|nr:WD40/YVTN repeat-like-containing domain protein [Ophiocordyceps sinensis CO18]
MSTTVQRRQGFETSLAQDKIVTGIYESGEAMPKILVHDRHGNISWSWNATMGTSHVPIKVRKCIQGGRSATEVKWAGNGDRIAAIIGRSAVIVGYSGQFDKTVLFAVCLAGLSANSHTVELLPGMLLAVATSGQTRNDGIYIYDANKMERDPRPIQTLVGVRAIHGMIWDQQGQKLWAAGTTDAADGSGGVAYSVVQGYAYNGESRPRLRESDTFTMPEAKHLSAEWKGRFSKWWDGAHDLVPVPDERVLLVPTELDIHALHLDNGSFSQGEQVAGQYLKRFLPLGERIGYDGEELPRSDIKSVSLHMDGSALYTQAPWRDPSGLTKQSNLLDSPSHDYSALLQGETMYRSRWFMNTPGWPSPDISEPKLFSGKC